MKDDTYIYKGEHNRPVDRTDELLSRIRHAEDLLEKYPDLLKNRKHPAPGLQSPGASRRTFAEWLLTNGRSKAAHAACREIEQAARSWKLRYGV